MRWITSLGVAMIVTGASAASVVQAAQAGVWSSTDAAVVEASDERDLNGWARALAGQPLSHDSKALAQRFSVLARAGHRAPLLEVIAALASAAPPLRGHDLREMADFLIVRRDWPAAEAFMAHLPHARPANANLLLRRREERGGERRLPAADLLQELADAVRHAPGVLDPALRYARAAMAADEERFDPSWLIDVYEPATASDATRLGAALARTDAAGVAVRFLELALAMPFAEADVSYVRYMTGSFNWCGSVETWEPWFRRHVEHTLLIAPLHWRSRRCRQSQLSHWGSRRCWESRTSNRTVFRS